MVTSISRNLFFKTTIIIPGKQIVGHHRVQILGTQTQVHAKERTIRIIENYKGSFRKNIAIGVLIIPLLIV